jgi:hypothetical protein
MCIVIFTCVACEQPCNNIYGPLPKQKKLDTLGTNDVIARKTTV